MNNFWSFLITAGLIFGFTAQSANAQKDLRLSEQMLIHILSNPAQAVVAKYDAKDSVGNRMQTPSVIQMRGQKNKYAVVYHTPYPVTGGYRYRVNLAVSDNLKDYQFVRMLVDNADMPKIAQVPGASWLVLTHEQWMGKPVASTAPAQLGFKLYYDFNDLLSGTARSSFIAPKFQTSLNGTPSIYDLKLVMRDNYYAVDGSFGFHLWDGSRDMNAVMKITNLFNPKGGTNVVSAKADKYNQAFIDRQVSGNIGQRDTIETVNGRYNIQEANMGQPGGSWDKWKIFLYTFREKGTAPDGSGSAMMLSPVTHKGSTSFGNPSISVVDRPDGMGKSVVVSYFLFGEGARPGEAGSLIYYFNIDN